MLVKNCQEFKNGGFIALHLFISELNYYLLPVYFTYVYFKT